MITAKIVSGKKYMIEYLMFEEDFSTTVFYRDEEKALAAYEEIKANKGVEIVRLSKLETVKEYAR